MIRRQRKCFTQNTQVAEWHATIDLAGMSAELPVSGGLTGAAAGPRGVGGGTAPRDVAPLPPQSVVGDYQILERLSCGGMGVVYKARHRVLGRVVALKTVLTGQVASEEEFARFRTEAEAVALLEHPHIVPIYEAGEHEGVPFFTMRLVEGRNLAAWRAEEGGGKPGAPASLGKPWVRRVVRLMITVARAIHHVHEQRVLHRDLKPSNVLVDGEDRPYVTDFGLARLLRRESDLTLTGATLGTPNYMSPEQAQGQSREVSFTADVFSLGAMLYELLTGRVAFQGDNALAVLKEVVEGDPPVPSLLNPHIDPDLETICLKCLEKDPKRRYAFAEELARDLERWERHEPISARRAGALERGRKWVKRHPLAAMVTVFVLVSLVGFASTMAHSQARLRRERDATLVQLAKSLIREGESYAANNRLGEAKQKVLESRELSRKQGGSTLQADLALLDIYRRSPPELLVFRGHDGPVRCLAASADSRTIYSGGADGTLRRWSLPLGRLESTWAAHPGGVTAMVSSRDGRFLVSGGADGLVKLWDLARPGSSRSLPAHSNQLVCLVFSPRGEVLLSADLAGWLHLWHGETFAHLRAVRTSHRDLRGVVFGTNTMHAVVASADGRGVIGWDLDNGQGGHQFLSAGQCLALASSPDGRVIFLSNTAGVVSRRDLVGRMVEDSALEVRSPSTALAVSSLLGRVATGGADGTVVVWDYSLRPSERVVVLCGHQGAVNGVDFLEPEGLLVSGGDDGTVRLWDIRPGQESVLSARENSDVYRARFLLGDRLVLASNLGGYAKVWDAFTGRLLQVFVGHEGCVYDVISSPNGQRVFSGGRDGTVRAWRMTDGQEIWRTRARAAARGEGNVSMRALALTSDGDHLVAGLDAQTNSAVGSVVRAHESGQVLVMESRSGVVTTNFPAHQRGVLAVAISPDQTKLATAGRDGLVKLWSLADWHLLASLGGGAENANDVVFSADGRHCFSVTRSGTPRVWDTETLGVARAFLGSSDRCVSLALSADEALLLGGMASGEMTLWDVALGEEIQVFQRQEGIRPVNAVGFAVGARQALAAGRSLHLWDFDQVPRLSSAWRETLVAQSVLQGNPASVSAMLRLAEWYALRGLWTWATELFQRAREQGALVRELEIARCLWGQGRLEEAAVRMAAAQVVRDAPELYLGLCQNAIQAEIERQRPPDYELHVPAEAIVTPSRPDAWKDIWTSTVFSHSPISETPGGGRPDDSLRVGGWGDTYESLLHLDLAGLPERAQSAILNLYCYEVVGYSNAMFLDRITADWDWRTQGTGWDRDRLWHHNKPPSEPWGKQPLPSPRAGRWYPIDVTGLYNAWKSGQYPNYGILLRPTFTANDTFNHFYSSRHRGHHGLWPRLVVVPAKE